MFTLSLALYDEGPTDHRFLAPVLQRACEALAFEVGPKPCEVFEVQRLEDASASAARDARILSAAESWRYGWDILFIHTDGAGDHDAAEQALVTPAIERICGSAAFNHDKQRCVPVIPVRETEAWMLAEPDALLRAWYVSRPTPAQQATLRAIKPPEQITDPKRQLDALYNALTGRRGASKTFDAIGREVSLDELRKLPSYKRMEAALRAALVDILR
jgi:hypothetical protein